VLITLQMTAGLVLLFFGGEWLVRGAAALAARLGISSLAIGLTVVAFGTSAPELVVSLDAALSGANDLAVGNVVGSNIANVALILGLAAMIRPIHVHAKIVRLHAPIMIGVSLLLVAVLFDGSTTRVEGVGLVLGLFVYGGFTFWEARREPPTVRDELASVATDIAPGTARAVAFVLAGVALLVGGGHLLVESAVSLATTLGLSQAAIGLTIVSVGTSLPELATSVVASLRRQGDIALGNIIGSNLFNILGILGVTTVVRPLYLGAVSPVDLGVMVGLACVLNVLIATRLRLDRLEGAGLLIAFFGYASWLLLV
jgi:cation:H+ antiporter